MLKIRIQLNGCEVDEATLTGFMAVSEATPDDFKGAEVKDDELTLLFESLPEVGAFQEVLRVIGGSAKGDQPMKVISPDKFKGATAVPHESKGAKRWTCPRCNAQVMEGHNDTQGALFGLCQRCHAVDTGQPPGDAPAPRPPAPAPAPKPAAPPPSSPSSSSSSEPAPQAAAEPAAAAEPSPHGFIKLPTMPSINALPHPPPHSGMFCVLEEGGLLCWSSRSGWHIAEGRIPPRES